MSEVKLEAAETSEDAFAQPPSQSGDDSHSVVPGALKQPAAGPSQSSADQAAGATVADSAYANVPLQGAQEKLGAILAKLRDIEAADAAATADRQPPHTGAVGAADDDPHDRPRILNGKPRADSSGEPHFDAEKADQEERRQPVADVGMRTSSGRCEYPVRRYGRRQPGIDPVSRRVSAAALGIAALAASFVFAGWWWDWKGDPSTKTVSNMAATPQIGVLGAHSEISLSDVLTIPAVSPTGTSRKEIDLDRALMLADRHLHGNGDTDRIEGEYWLRHALSKALGDERTKWALTQLGSAYASTKNAGALDYDKARLLWEIAGQLGDAVALCFLGSLHEHGLGVPADKASALAWYARAKQAGGCPEIDEALARVTR